MLKWNRSLLLVAWVALVANQASSVAFADDKDKKNGGGITTSENKKPAPAPHPAPPAPPAPRPAPPAPRPAPPAPPAPRPAPPAPKPPAPTPPAPTKPTPPAPPAPKPPAPTPPAPTKPTPPAPTTPTHPTDPKPQPPTPPAPKPPTPPAPKPPGPGPRPPGPGPKPPTPPQPPRPPLKPVPVTERKQSDGSVAKVSPSGKIRETVKVDPKTGHQETVKINPATGRPAQKIEVDTKTGVTKTVDLDRHGNVKTEVVANKDGTKIVVKNETGRNGKAIEAVTVKVDARGREVSKVVVVNKTAVVVVTKSVVIRDTIVIGGAGRFDHRDYNRGRYGFVYAPVIFAPLFYSAWYDPFWYTPTPSGYVYISHPFRYTAWAYFEPAAPCYTYYRYHHRYFANYVTYPSPAYWVTDWIVAGYLADRYNSVLSAEQARADAEQARADAEAARASADAAAAATQAAADDAAKAALQAELDEALQAKADAEAKQKEAEDKLAETQASEDQQKADQDKPLDGAIDETTKEDMKNQVEESIARKKASPDGVAPDVLTALKNPKHIYPVSSSLSVSDVDGNPAGNVSQGDLLRVEKDTIVVQDDKVMVKSPQGDLSEADENSLISMRVITSKGEDGEAKAGTVISLTLSSLQDMDSEFLAKLDKGLAEADANKDEFKKSAAQ